MAAIPSITKADVEAAIRDLQARRLHPSVRLIRRALGNRGSNDLILRLRAEILGLPDRVDDAAPPAHLLLRIQDVAPDLWKSAVQDARAAVAADMAHLQEQLQLAQTQAGESTLALADLQGQLTQERQERERLAGVLVELAKASDALGDRQRAVEQGLHQQADGMADLRATITGQGAAFQGLFLDADERWRRDAAAARERSASDQARIAELQAQLQEARNQVDAQQAATQAAEARTQATQEHLDQAQHERQALTHDLAAARQAAQQAAEQSARLQEQAVVLTASQARSEQQASDLRRDLVEVRASAAALQAERDAAVATRAELEERLLRHQSTGMDAILQHLHQVQATMADLGARLPPSAPR